MQIFTVFSAVEQVAEHLRRELQRGEWGETMPGVNPLVQELGVNHKTVEAALRLLEDEGLLVNQGRGFQRRIVVREDAAPPAMRVALLEFDAKFTKPGFLTGFLTPAPSTTPATTSDAPTAGSSNVHTLYAWQFI